MQCTPKVVGPETELKIIFPQGHGDNFDIVRPDNIYMTVVEDHPQKNANLITPWESFETLKNITIKVKDIRGLNSPKPAHRVFTMDGVYLFMTGTELETEPENQVVRGLCKVEYRHDLK